MNLNKFAGTILMGNTLQDKFCTFDETLENLAETLPAFEIPKEPGRPNGLKFSDWWEKPKGTFPNKNEIRANSKKERGKVFHFFANHELLAMELMALCILRFPNAPIAFRKGLAHTIREEQKHLKLYLDRMDFFGVSFGDIGVNDFFWRFVSSMKSPEEFVASMSLTFEQANLDFAKEYLDLFEEIGDLDSAQVMRTVYLEEIGHVKHGVTWAQKWKDDNESLWNFYIRNLPDGLSPVRAKGSQSPLGFDFEARHLSGMDAEFCENVFSFSESKGRVPKVFWFVGDENPQGTFPENKSLLLKGLEQDFATLPLFFASSDDIVLCDKEPTIEFKLHLLRNGVLLPQFKTLKEIENVKTGVADVLPWTWNRAVAKTSSSFRFAEKTVRSKACAALLEQDSTMNPASKVWSKKIAKEFSPLVYGNSFSSLLEIETFIANSNFNEYLVKAPFSSSGRHRALWSAENKLKIEKWIIKFGAVVCEPLFKKIYDFSAHGTVLENGRVRFDGLCHFLTSPKGAFLGTTPNQLFPEMFFKDEIMFSELKRFFYQVGNCENTMKQAIDFVGAKLAEIGFSGSFGIDALISYDKENFELIPIVEVNPRQTMGRVSLMLEKYLSKRSSSVWLHTILRSENQGIELRQKLLEHPNKHFTNGQIEQGVLLTTDIMKDSKHAAILFVEKDRESLSRLMNSFIEQ
jgi:uncharacterized ferritin-like protein (DUF455 family)